VYDQVKKTSVLPSERKVGGPEVNMLLWLVLLHHNLLLSWHEAENPLRTEQLLNIFFSFGYTSKFTPTAFWPNTLHSHCCSVCSFQVVYFGAWLVEKLHEDVNMYSERKWILIIPCSFYVVFLLPLYFLLKIIIILHPFFSFFLFADQSPSYFLPDTYHLGVCKEPVLNFQTDQRRLAQLRELRAKFFLS
jgi:hypothetical protein